MIRNDMREKTLLYLIHTRYLLYTVIDKCSVVKIGRVHAVNIVKISGKSPHKCTMT